MIDATELEAMRDKLLRARAAGTRTVRYSDGREVTYATGAEMAAALADLERRIADARHPRLGAIRPIVTKGAL